MNAVSNHNKPVIVAGIVDKAAPFVDFVSIKPNYGGRKSGRKGNKQKELCRSVM
jgi:hypothetical protein